LFTDVEGSTRRWEADADGMRAALVTHDEVLHTAIEKRRGRDHNGGPSGRMEYWPAPMILPSTPLRLGLHGRGAVPPLCST
jgi:class 3 adenylate cyclase